VVKTFFQRLFGTSSLSDSCSLLGNKAFPSLPYHFRGNRQVSPGKKRGTSSETVATTLRFRQILGFAAVGQLTLNPSCLTALYAVQFQTTSLTFHQTSHRWDALGSSMRVPSVRVPRGHPMFRAHTGRTAKLRFATETISLGA